jgi:hypothetical protein
MAATAILVLLALVSSAVVRRLFRERAWADADRARLLLAEQHARAASEEARAVANQRRRELELDDREPRGWYPRVQPRREEPPRGRGRLPRDAREAASIRRPHQQAAGRPEQRAPLHGVRAGSHRGPDRAGAGRRDRGRADVGGPAQGRGTTSSKRVARRPRRRACCWPSGSRRRGDHSYRCATRPQIVGNLLSNAIKYTESGRITVVVATWQGRTRRPRQALAVRLRIGPRERHRRATTRVPVPGNSIAWTRRRDEGLGSASASVVGWPAPGRRLTSRPARARIALRVMACGRFGRRRCAAARGDVNRARDLIWPSAEHLPSYTAALERGWSPEISRPEAAREELARVAADRSSSSRSRWTRRERSTDPPAGWDDGAAAPGIPAVDVGRRVLRHDRL